MKRLEWSVLLAVAVGCTQPPASLPANLKDPEAMALKAPLLFVASTGTDELRVLSLNPTTTSETYVEAPNPLYVLSIPVVSRPFAMALDSDGTTPGNFAFVLSAAENRLGIVDATGLVELQEVALPGTPMSVAARSTADGGARVYVGIASGTHGSISIIDVPQPSLVGPGLPVNSTYADLETAEPAALAISPDGTTLAIGDRLADEANPDPAQRRGGLILLDISDPTAAHAGAARRVEVGGPVRKLVFNPFSTEFIDGGAPIPPGRFLYAVIDDRGCGLGKACGGVQVIVDGAVPETAPGQPWLPMQVPGQATDVSVGAGPYFNLPPEAGLGGAIRVPLLLTIPATDGRIYFADGVGGRVYNVDYLQPSVTVPLQHLDPNGTPIASADGGADPSGPSDIRLSEGAIASGTIAVTFVGVLPVLARRPFAFQGATLTDTDAAFADLGVEVGDWVTFSSSNPDCAATLLHVVEVGALGGALGPRQLRLDQDLGSSACAADASARYSVISGPGSADPYVVVGSAQGLLGRTHPNATFQSPAAYFYRPPAFDPAVPGLTFSMGPGATGSQGTGPAPGESWTFQVDSGVLPMFILGGLNGLVPGPAAWDQDLASFFVGYPGSNVGSEVVQFAPASVSYNSNGNVTEWE